MTRTNDDTPLRILIISDGSLGRYRRSQTIAAAITRNRPTVVNTVEINPNRRFHRFLGKLTGFRLPPSILLTILLGNRWRQFPVSDLVISAGGITLRTNIALAHIWDVPSIFSGDRRRIPSDPDVILTMNPNNVSAPKHQFALTCARLDPDELPPPNRNIRSIGVMIGGPNDEIDYAIQDWIQLAGIIRKLTADSYDVTVATSPRTPVAFYDTLGDLTDKIDLIDFRTTGPTDLDAVFDRDAILVTIDSTSMIVEGITAKRPVLALKPVGLSTVPDSHLLETLAEERRLLVCELSNLSSEELTRKLRTLEPMKENALDIIYRIISPKLVR